MPEYPRSYNIWNNNNIIYGILNIIIDELSFRVEG